jgi:hypothetical protein
MCTHFIVSFTKNLQYKQNNTILLLYEKLKVLVNITVIFFTNGCIANTMSKVFRVGFSEEIFFSMVNFCLNVNNVKFFLDKNLV